MNINPNDKIAYTGRCPQIKDAQWVCHIVRSDFPHFSSTRFSAPVYKYIMNNLDLYNSTVNASLKRNFGSKTPEQQKLTRIFEWRRRSLQKYREIRDFRRYGCHTTGGSVNNILKQFENDRFGNCGEDAYVSAAILNINGIKNAYTAGLKVDNDVIDHAVCVFNKDGAPLTVKTFQFDGTPVGWKINRNTIIIDPWLDAADFASNMFVKYKNLCRKFFSNIKDNSKFELCNVKIMNLTGADKLLLSLEHKNLRYPSLRKDFME